MVTLRYNVYVRMALLLMALSLHIYPCWSMLMALIALLRSALWGVIQMSWVTLFLRVHEWWVLFHPCLVFSFLHFSILVPTLSSSQFLAHCGGAWGAHLAGRESQARGDQVLQVDLWSWRVFPPGWWWWWWWYGLASIKEIERNKQQLCMEERQ